MAKKKSKIWDWVFSFKDKLLSIVVITACLSTILGAIATYVAYPIIDKRYATNEKMDSFEKKINKKLRHHKH